MIILLFLILIVAAVWFVVVYNRQVRLGNLIRESWSNVDTELKRRYDLIPNLEETVKGYARHEKDVMENLARARSQAVSSIGSPESQAIDENVLISALRTVFAVAEKYPELKASKHFLELQTELANTEDRIQSARRFYNGNVREYNILTETFPSRIVASFSGARPREYFKIDRGISGINPEIGF